MNIHLKSCSLCSRHALLGSVLFSITTINANAETLSWSPWITNQNDIKISEPLSDASEIDTLKTRVSAVGETELKNIQHWQSDNANYRWMQLLLAHYAKGPPSPNKGRGIALLNVAIYDAIAISHQAKETYKRPRPAELDTHLRTRAGYSYPSSHAAAAGAAAKILNYLLPESAVDFKAEAAAAGASRIDAGVNFPSDIEEGFSIGKQVAEQLIAFAKNDNSDSKWAGERPTGPDKLQGEVFVYPTAGNWKPWGIKSTRDYLPEPPDAVGSAELDAQLSALHAIDRSVPHAIRAWTNHSTERAYQWWYEKIATAAFELGNSGSTEEIAHAYATIAAANHDAVLACFHAKYTYWFIRPGQLDSTLPTLFPNPPHPSYPAAHSCSTRSLAVAIGHFFPTQTDPMHAAADEAGYSRQIGGIHYPMDQEAGDVLGSKVAADVLNYATTLMR